MQRSGFGPGSSAWLFFFWELGFLLLVWQGEGWRWVDGINCRRCLTYKSTQRMNKTTQLHSWFLSLTYPMCSLAFVYAHRICTFKFLLHIYILYIFKRFFYPLPLLQPESFFPQQPVLGKSNVLTSLETENIPPAKGSSSKPSSSTQPIQKVSGWQSSLHFSRCKPPKPCSQPPLHTHTNCPTDPPGTTPRPSDWFHATHYTDMFQHFKVFPANAQFTAVFMREKHSELWTSPHN